MTLTHSTVPSRQACISPETLCVRPAHAADVRLAGRLRAADLAEIQAAVGWPPEEVLRYGIEVSRPCFAVTHSVGDLLALFGVEPEIRHPGVGRVWFLGSDAVTANSFAFLRQSKNWIDELHNHYAELWNFIDARNRLQIRWLKWCGFSLVRPVERHGIERRPFYEFRKVRTPVTTPARQP